jgi:hypothetical protein
MREHHELGVGEADNIAGHAPAVHLLLPPIVRGHKLLPIPIILLTIISILTLLTFSSNGIIPSGAYAAGTSGKEKKAILLGSQIISRKTVSSWRGSHPLSEAWLLEARRVVLSKSQH